MVRPFFHRWCLLLGLIGVLLLGAQGEVSADAPHTSPTAPFHKKAILVLVNRLSVRDLAAGPMPLTREWVKQSAFGLMNSNTGGEKTDLNTYLTMALGVPATSKIPPQIYNPEERTREGGAAGRIYEERTGRAAAGPLLINAPVFRQALEKLPYASSLGLLGDAWSAHGVRTAVIGGMDEGTIARRYGALFILDEAGRASGGKLLGRDAVSAAPLRPFGMRTDVKRVEQLAIPLLNGHDLLIIDDGDLSRLEDGQKMWTRARYDQVRQEILRETDRLIDVFMRKADADTLVMLAVPRVSVDAASRGEWLAPLVVRGGRIQPGTLLTSSTTRREGIVSNLDVAPTLLTQMQIPVPPKMLGHPLQGGIEAGDPLAKGYALAVKTAQTYIWRPKVMIGYGLCALLLLLYFVVQARMRVQPFSRRLAEEAGIALLSLPLLWLFFPLFPAGGWLQLAVGTAGLAAFLGGLSLIRPFLLRLAVLGLLTATAVVADIGTGGRMAAASVLSYDPIVGARYYGVGNEYMGYTLGAVLLACGCLLEAYPRWRKGIVALFVAIFAFFLYFFASPRWGTNAGGTLTAAASFAVTLFLLRKKRWTPAGWAVLGLSLLAALTILVALNRPELPLDTHISQAARMVWQQGGSELGRTILRKWQTSWRVINWTFLGPVFLVLLGFFLVFLFRRNPFMERIREEYPFLSVAVTGLTAGACIGVCVNDSGIVVAVMMMLLVLFPSCMILSRRALERQGRG
jgi:hypothetical protein